MLLSSGASIEPNLHKIAVLRANALGDFIFALPALSALRFAYPKAEIVLLAREWHQRFLVHRPSPIDRVIVIPPGGIGNEQTVGQDPLALEVFFRQMAQERFDLAIQLHGGGRNSNPFVQRLGAKMTIGLRTPDAPLLDRCIPYLYYQPEILRYLEVVSLVGATATLLEPALAVTEADRAESLQVVPDTDRPLVVLHPGASDPRRCWPVDKFAAVGDALTAIGAAIGVTGTEPEQPLVDAVIARMQTPARNLCGRLSLNGLTGLLSRSRLVVSNDSGPLHLAAAVGAATIGIYWCGNLITAGPVTRTRHRPLISWQLQCPICGLDCTRHTCRHSASFVADIPVSEVIDAAYELLAFPDCQLAGYAFSQEQLAYQGI